MEASGNAEWKHAFVLKEADVRKVWELLQLHIGTVACSGECADGITRQFGDVDKILEFNNAKQKGFKRIVFDSMSEDRSNFANLEFSENRWKPISVRISGSEEVVVKLKGEIEDVIHGMRPWYSRFTRVDFFYVGLAILSPLSGFLLVLSQGRRIKSLTMNGAIQAFVGSTVLVFVIGVSIWILNKLRERLFPICCFALGQGKDRYATQEKIRWGLVWVIVPLIIASVGWLLHIIATSIVA